MRERLMIAAPDGPQARFLTVLQGMDAGATPVTLQQLQSGVGDRFDGVVVQQTLVWFKHDLAPLSQLNYQAPAGLTSHLISGLAPNTGYQVTTNLTSQGVEVTIQPGGTTMSDQAGVVTIWFGSQVYLPTINYRTS